jgi:tryptophan synthase beta subunit
MSEQIDLVEQLAREAEAQSTAPVGNMTRLMTYANELEVLSDEVDQLTAQLKQRKERYNELRKDLIPSEMERLGITSAGGRGVISTTSGARINLRSDLHVSVKEADEQALNAWARSNGLASIVKEKIHGMTLKGVMRERLDEGEAIPPMVTTYYETYAVLTRSKT